MRSAIMSCAICFTVAAMWSMCAGCGSTRELVVVVEGRSVAGGALSVPDQVDRVEVALTDEDGDATWFSSEAEAPELTGFPHVVNAVLDEDASESVTVTATLEKAGEIVGTATGRTSPIPGEPNQVIIRIVAE